METEQEFNLWAVESETNPALTASANQTHSAQYTDEPHQQTYQNNFAASQIIATESEQRAVEAETKAAAEKATHRLGLPFLLLDVREKAQYDQSHIITGNYERIIVSRYSIFSYV